MVVKIRILMWISLFLLNACVKPVKIDYSRGETNVLKERFQQEEESKKKLLWQYLMQAQQDINLERYGQADLILLKALELQVYKNHVSYYLAKNKAKKGAYQASNAYLVQGFDQDLYFKFVGLKLKADNDFELKNYSAALKNYKQCLNMRSDDEYVKKQVELCKARIASNEGVD